MATNAAPRTNPSREPPYETIKAALEAGRVIPFVGAGASIVDRPEGIPWTENAAFPPRGAELSCLLAEEAHFQDVSDDPRDREDLLKVAAYFEQQSGREELRFRLHQVLARPHPTGRLHAIPRLAHEPPADRHHQLRHVARAGFRRSRAAFRSRRLSQGQRRRRQLHPVAASRRERAHDHPVRRAGEDADRPPDNAGDLQDARQRGRTRARRTRQLRHHRGRLHRFPLPDDNRYRGAEVFPALLPRALASCSSATASWTGTCASCCATWAGSSRRKASVPAESTGPSRTGLRGSSSGCGNPAA